MNLFKHRQTAVLAAAIILAPALLHSLLTAGSRSSSAAAENETFTVSDAHALQQHLLGTAALSAAESADLDLDSDGVVNGIDLALLKRSLVHPTAQTTSLLYEAEDAALSGNLTTYSDSCSGGQAVGNFASDEDCIAFTIEIPTDGRYDFCFSALGIGGEKDNDVYLDGTKIGSFHSPADSYSEGSIRCVSVSEGTHTVQVKKSWGWIRLDYLKITSSETISEDVYAVSSQLINPNANTVTNSLFSYLCQCYGNVTLAGQTCDGGYTGTEFSAIYEVTGKYPAILGLDMMDYTPSRTALGTSSRAVETAIDFWNRGGIVTFCWHWNAPTSTLVSDTDENGNPSWWGGFYTKNTNFDLAQVMNGSDPEGKANLDADIAEIAAQLLRLQEAGVPVLWRPLHEASGGWFWWGASGAEAYKQLWIYLYDQLTNVYGCNNLIWVWNGQHPDWYPGDGYVDIIGEDIYPGERVYSAQTSRFLEACAYSDTNQIIALTENGCVFDIDDAVASNTHWAWFLTWGGEFTVSGNTYSEQYTEISVLQKAYDSEFVITLDELPDFHSATE